ncbi:5-carboxymethyl-2-hydroxymuconate Delta-isomerase [Aestuariibacter sp. AA17]|uniref:5-carboxymethyl-2-hydroxymuconate Delta-isomerase n=1 Tax=Fluctibacter corallii TaxID=2984329 RepID=A0ABT3A4N8_9ALTE|nr:5-carboxymethyl-2-hydroxymuconate Delta-isomerase [Aestuariibacter sp. AA17]MCV2883207.1 5-carboxymethyl-2-hydroxymuconate Delta-isomerase [Aestuariibacter sp. AA17]
MPSCIIEYSKGVRDLIAPRSIVESVHLSAIQSALFSTKDIKTRASICKHYKVGDGNDEFIHVVLSIMPGRTESQKARLSQTVAENLAELPLTNISITVQVIEIDASSYTKILQ